LLLALSSCNVKSLVLLLNATHFTFDFLNPVLVGLLLAFVIFTFEFADFFQFSFFFNFKKSLLNRLGEKHVENRLDFSVIVEEIVVFNLSDLINTGLLRDVLGRWRLRLEVVSLAFNFNFPRLLTSLFLQEISKVNFNSGWITRSQIVRAGLRLLFFEFY